MSAPNTPNALPGEVELIEKTAMRVGMKSLLNHGAASCVYSEGCSGVSQAHLVAFAREVALHCAAALATPPAAPAAAAGTVMLDRAQVEELRRIIHDANQPLGNRLQMVSSRLALALDGAGWVATPPAASPAKWIDDPHDIEQGQMLNPEWLKLHGLTAAEAAADEPDDTPLETGEGDAR